MFSSIGDIIDWLLCEGELQRTYQLVSDNCQDFAKRLFETVAATKKYPNKIKTGAAILVSMNACGFTGNDTTTLTEVDSKSTERSQANNNPSAREHDSLSNALKSCDNVNSTS